MKKLIMSVMFLMMFGVANCSFALTDKEVCDANGIDLQQAKSFISDLRNALKTDDKNKIADMMEYPVRINKTNQSGKTITSYIKTKDDFIKQYAVTFTEKTKKELEKGDVFCHEGGASVGGFIWFKTSSDGDKIFSINPE